MKPKTISRDTLKQHLDNGDAMTLVEALPARYYDAGHLPGAINIPHDQIKALAPSLLPDKSALIVVYCANKPCQNSLQATMTLNQLGYGAVYEYVEGKADWEAAGYPLETATETA